MLFSVIIPIYNISQYMQTCVDSVLEQKNVDVEIILVNDGSTDDSGILCDEYARNDSRIVVIHKQNGGLSDARNAGLQVAQGEYVLFVDGDDYIATDSLSELVHIIEEGNYPDVVCLELTKFFEDNVNTVPMQDGIDFRINDLRGNDLYDYLANLPKYPASACTKAIRRELFIKNDLYFTKDLLSEDLEWCIRLFLVAKTFRYCPHPYYFYRQARNDSISNTPSEKKTMDILNTFYKWTQYAKKEENVVSTKMICSYMEYVFRFLLLGFENITKKRRKKFAKDVKKGSWVLGTRKDFNSKLICVCYKMFGIRITGYLLKNYLKIRGY